MKNFLEKIWLRKSEEELRKELEFAECQIREIQKENASLELIAQKKAEETAGQQDETAQERRGALREQINSNRSLLARYIKQRVELQKSLGIESSESEENAVK